MRVRGYFLRQALSLALLAGIVLPVLGAGSSVSAQNTEVSWNEDLTVSADRAVNVVNTAHGLTIGAETLPSPDADGSRNHGILTLPQRSVDWPVTHVGAALQASIPPGARVQVDVRGQAADGSWTEWLATPDVERLELPFSTNTIQARLTLLDDGHGIAPLVHGLTLVAEGSHGHPEAKPRNGPLTYRIYATREGLVGHRTANGHIIRPNDRFVALPSFRSLCAKAVNPCEYMVEIYYPKTGLRARAPVWDVGPWNTRDDYWNPSSVRQNWRDLPQGRPQAHAAYYDGYNGGRDQFGRIVRHPNGIDIGDGTFWHDLGMKDNDWVEVTFLWTGGGPAWEAVVDDTPPSFNGSGSWGAVEWPGPQYGSNFRVTMPAPVSDAAWFRANIPEDGVYEVFVWYPAHADYNAATPFLVNSANGIQVVKVDQRVNGGRWHSIGLFNLNAGEQQVVGVSRWSSHPGYIAADAVKIVQR